MTTNRNNSANRRWMANAISLQSMRAVATACDWTPQPPWEVNHSWFVALLHGPERDRDCAQPSGDQSRRRVTGLAS